MNKTVNIVVWQAGGAWLGYLQDYPDYWTQGKTRKELKSASERFVSRNHKRRNPEHPKG
jgi:predicted RNase H-like HicB family nuclease